MFMNGIPFLVTFSRYIILIACKYVPTHTAGQLARYIMKIGKLYARGSFMTRLVLLYMEIKMIKDKFSLLEFNTIAAREHVADIERQILLMKEITR